MLINREILASAKCADTFSMIYWSVLFVSLDAHIPLGRNLTISLVPDLFGWLIVAFALFRIAELSPRLANMRKLTAWLIGLSLFQIVQSETTLKNLGGLILWIHPVPFIGVWGAVLFTIVWQILTAILVCQFCSLIVDMAIVAQEGKLQRKATLYKKIYISVIATYFFPLSFFLIFKATLSKWIFVTVPNILLAANPLLLIISMLVVMLLCTLPVLPLVLAALLTQDVVKMCRRCAALH